MNPPVPPSPPPPRPPRWDRESWRLLVLLGLVIVAVFGLPPGIYFGWDAYAHIGLGGAMNSYREQVSEIDRALRSVPLPLGTTTDPLPPAQPSDEADARAFYLEGRNPLRRLLHFMCDYCRTWTPNDGVIIAHQVLNTSVTAKETCAFVGSELASARSLRSIRTTPQQAACEFLFVRGTTQVRVAIADTSGANCYCTNTNIIVEGATRREKSELLKRPADCPMCIRVGG